MLVEIVPEDNWPRRRRTAAEVDLKYDQVLESIGGFGLFQWLMVFQYINTMMAVFWIVLSMPYLELMPQNWQCQY